MSWIDSAIALLPEHCLLAGIVVAIAIETAGTARRTVPLLVAVIAVGFAAAAAAFLAASGYAFAAFPGHYSADPPALLAKAVVLALALPVLVISRNEAQERAFPALFLSSLYGLCLLLSADSFVTLFLGLELMSLPVYALILVAFRRSESAEGALKYLVLGGAATATLLMGVSLLYGWSASMSLSTFRAALRSPDAIATTGAVLIVIAFFVKAAVVPFHTWAPDAYESATPPVTAFMATIVKAGVLLAAARAIGDATLSRPMSDVIALLSLASIVWGNLAAMRQPSFRRMIAYSSIAHAGYLFYAFLGDGPSRLQAVVFYVLAYGLTNLLAFASLPRGPDDAPEDRLDNLRGLFRRQPYCAIAIAVAMLSLAGIPPFPGFIAKFLIFKNVIAAGFTAYAVLGLLGSYLGIYFYLRVIQLLFMSAEDAPVAERAPASSARGASVLCLSLAIAVSVFPGWVIDRLRGYDDVSSRSAAATSSAMSRVTTPDSRSRIFSPSFIIVAQ
ncbi:MAG TPA: NADH-quinone oxidoreductase subunit N [Casimicrobiaceae bacterium]|nr:NADH-quinone oxidoreductase subunit N [Casimicrobiaceae bacterium]